MIERDGRRSWGYGAAMPPSQAANDRTISRSVEVAASAEQAWRLISDLPRMGELSPENVGGRWLAGATGPAVGARFRGNNKRGWRRWSTQVEVTECEPGQRFAFDVSSLGLAVATWSYDLEPAGDQACAVTETWIDRRGRVISALGALATGVSDRGSTTAQNIEHTLARIQAALVRG